MGSYGSVRALAAGSGFLIMGALSTIISLVILNVRGVGGGVALMVGGALGIRASRREGLAAAGYAVAAVLLIGSVVFLLQFLPE